VKAGFLLFVLFAQLIQVNTQACDSFQLNAQGTNYVAKGYDWKFGDGYLIFNPAHLTKMAMIKDQKFSWASHYSSLTFNQYGVEFPNGGMNDAGLTVEILWLEESIYPVPDQRPAINELQWIQFILDTQNNVQGVADVLNTLRIQPIYAAVHYFVCDTKDCVTIEFINGVAQVGKYNDQPYRVITNSTYKNSFDYLKKFQDFGGNENVPFNSKLSLDRFVLINWALDQYKKKYLDVDPMIYAFGSLDTVKAPDTQWQIVYNKTDQEINFRTTFGTKDLAKIAAKTFSGKDCHQRLYFDLSNAQRGDLSDKFAPLTQEKNYALVKSSLDKVMPGQPDEFAKKVAGIPYTFVCNQGSL
jgi:hypothetical protein